MVIFHCYVSSSEGRGYPEPSWTCIVDLCFVLNPFPHCQACGHQEADEYLLQLGLPVRLAEQLWTESCREPKPQDFFLRVAGRTYHIMCFCSFQDCEGCQGWFHGNKYDLHRHIIILITAHVLLKTRSLTTVFLQSWWGARHGAPHLKMLQDIWADTFKYL